MTEAQTLPKYKCHKIVQAVQIAAISYGSADHPRDGTAVLTPYAEEYAPFAVSAAYVRKHVPQVGGYYVRYEDGYESFSPADVFEAGYTRLP